MTKVSALTSFYGLLTAGLARADYSDKGAGPLPSRLRVLQVVLSLSPGGTERLVIEICHRLRHAVESAVCCLDQPGEWAHELSDAGIPVVALQRQGGFRPLLGRRIAQLAARLDSHAIHCHQYSPYVYGAIAKLLTRRVGLVFTEHGRLADATVSRKRQLVNPWLSRVPGQLFAVSADLKRHMVSEGFPEDRIEVVHNGIDVGPAPSETDRVAARQELGVPVDAYVIGTAGRLDPVKDLQTLLRAHVSLLANDSRSCLAIVGDGPELPDLQALASSLGIRSAVRFAGYRPDVRKLLPAFDVFVNCSTFEGVSLTILEAMAAGLPVVATRVGGTPEVVLDGKTGMLVPPKAVGPLAAAALAFASEPNHRRDMGAAGRSRVTRHFSIDRMVGRYARAYEDASLGGVRNR